MRTAALETHENSMGFFSSRNFPGSIPDQPEDGEVTRRDERGHIDGSRNESDNVLRDGHGADDGGSPREDSEVGTVEPRAVSPPFHPGRASGTSSPSCSPNIHQS